MSLPSKSCPSLWWPPFVCVFTASPVGVKDLQREGNGGPQKACVPHLDKQAKLQGAGGRGLQPARESPQARLLAGRRPFLPEEGGAMVLKSSSDMLFSQISLVYLSYVWAPSVQSPK